MLNHPYVKDVYKGEVNRLVNSLPIFKAYEHIRCFRLLPKQFEIGRELTPTLKLKRRVIEAVYIQEINNMSAEINQ